MMRQAMVVTLGVVFAALGAQAKEAPGSWVYIGTRAGPPPATASAEEQAQAKASPQGIYAARLDAATGKLRAVGLQTELARASWLMTNPKRPVIYSIARAPDGAAMVAAKQPEAPANIHSFAVDTATGTLRQINQVSSGALYTTHLALDGKSMTLFGAGFESNDVTALPLLPDGSVGNVASTQKNFGSGPHPRQKAPHPHSVAIDPSGRYLLSADLGADRIFIYRFDPKTRQLTRAEPQFEGVVPGSAPRHLAFSPDGKFLIMNTELSAELHSYRWDAKQGRLQPIAAVSAYPAGYSGTDKSSAEIAFSKDGRFLYVCLRGDQDALVVYEMNKSSGALTEVQRLSSGGKRPWSFGIDPTGRWLLAMNEASNSVNVFGVDRSTGKLTPTTESLSVPNPSAVTFVTD
jgi:6-phosphogluconolactonase